MVANKARVGVIEKHKKEDYKNRGSIWRNFRFSGYFVSRNRELLGGIERRTVIFT